MSKETLAETMNRWSPTELEQYKQEVIKRLAFGSGGAGGSATQYWVGGGGELGKAIANWDIYDSELLGDCENIMDML